MRSLLLKNTETHKNPYRKITYLLTRWLSLNARATKQKGEPQMYLGEILAYPIWLYIGLSVIATVRKAWQNMEG